MLYRNQLCRLAGADVSFVFRTLIATLEFPQNYDWRYRVISNLPFRRVRSHALLDSASGLAF